VVNNKSQTQWSEDKALKTRLVARDQSALKDPNDAQDIVHETMMEIWRKAERFEGRSSLKSWMFSIARNKSIDRNRKAKKLQYRDTMPDSVDEGSTNCLIHIVKSFISFSSKVSHIKRFPIWKIFP